ncbi:MAG: polysaccharide deacetylase family protein [Chthoniobacterales bacterium]|nr:polysaccharide deacetylase family protein [Chthoniobacterales bacterium]
MKSQHFLSHRPLALAASLFLLLRGSVTAQTPPAAPSPETQKRPAGTAIPAPAPPAISYSAVHVDGPYIAMTFDDGPSEKLTLQLLDILAADHIHATFFVIGQNAERAPEILQRAVREGHEIGNHSWSHPAFAKMSDAAVRREIQKTDDAIRAAIGHSPVLLRPPYGSITIRQKQWIHSEFGYRIILWDVDPLDWKRPGPTIVMNRIVRQTRPGSIILSHDIHPGTIKAMPETFDQLQARGFKFVTVSELIAMGKPMPPQEPRAESPSPVSSPAASPAMSVPPAASPAPSLTSP